MIIYLLLSGSSLLFSLFVYLQRRKAVENIYYLLFTIFINLWLTGVLLNHTPDNLFELHFRMLFPAAALMSYFLLLFITEIAGYRFSLLAKNLLRLVILFIFGVSLFTDLINASVVRVDGQAVVFRGPLYLPVSILIALGGVAAIAIIIHKIKSPNLDLKKQKQLNIVGASLVISVGIAIFSNVLLPALSGSIKYGVFAPLALLTISFGLGYSVWRHGLFDIRSFTFTSFVYTLSFSTLVAGIFGTFYLLSDNLGIWSLSWAERSFFVFVSVVTGLLFFPLLKTYNKITSKLFYRDYYDPQDMLDDLNNDLVVAKTLQDLLSRTAKNIQKNLKSSHVTFFIRQTSCFPDRVISIGLEDKISTKTVNQIIDLTPKISRKIHLASVQSVNSLEDELNSLMCRNDFELLGRIVNSTDFEVKGLGIFLLGPKKSGAKYTQQDLRVLEIIAKELMIAIENIIRYEEIEQFSVTLQKKIDSATRQLKTSNQKLKALDQAKDEFVSMASHQLRTPLTSIKGYLSMVLEGDVGELSADQKDLLGQAFYSSQRMVYLIADLLNASRLKTGKFVIERQPTDLAKLVKDEVSQLKEGIKAKNIKLSVKIPKHIPELMLDQMKTRQVVMNFVDNAIYYTPEGGSIKVRLINAQQSLQLTVTDTGIGVPEDQQHKLFTKFYRADNARRIRPDGTGLGLFMAKKVIVAQGGSIIFKSQENKGSTFGFSFPKKDLKV